MQYEDAKTDHIAQGSAMHFPQGVNDLRNLAIAINQGHTKEYAKAVFRALRQA
jgi:hypothetical protein